MFHQKLECLLVDGESMFHEDFPQVRRFDPRVNVGNASHMDLDIAQFLSADFAQRYLELLSQNVVT